MGFAKRISLSVVAFGNLIPTRSATPAPMDSLHYERWSGGRPRTSRILFFGIEEVFQNTLKNLNAL